MTNVGFIGPGRMGEPMIERLTAAGHTVTVHARRDERRAELARAGHTAVKDLRAVVRAVDIAVVCLFSDEQLQQVAPTLLANLPAGSTLVSHVTGSVSAIRQLASWAREGDIDVVDAPVSGTAEEIRNGELTVLLGGEDTVVARCRDVLAAYADPILPTGPLGSALSMKLVNNLVFAANVQLLAEATSLGESLGLDSRTVLRALQHCSGGSSAARRAAQIGDVQAFGARLTEFLAKDIAACESAANELGVVPRLLLEVVRHGPLTLTRSS